MKLFRALAALSTIAAALCAPALPSAHADPVGSAFTPDPTYTLATGAPKQLLVVADRVYIVSGGSYGLLVRDLEGAAVATVRDLPGADGLALSPDGSRLYVALYDGDAVAAIDTATLTEVARYETGPATCPRQLAAAGARVVFLYGCQSNVPGPQPRHLGVIDLGTSSVSLAQEPDGYHPQLLLATPQGPVASFDGATPTIDIVDPATTPVTLSHEVPSAAIAMSVSSDGQQLVVAGPGSVDLRSLSDLALVSSSAVTVLNGVAYAAASPTLTAVAPGNGQIDISDATGTVRRLPSGNVRPFAFDASGTRLYRFTDSLALEVVHDPGKHASDISLTAPTGAQVQHPFVVTGQLTSDGALTPGTHLQVVRTHNGTSTVLDTTTNGDGTFALPDTVVSRGTYSYQVSWGGDETHVGTTASTTFGVKGLASVITLVSGHGPYAYGAKVTITFRVAGASGGTLTMTSAVRTYPSPSTTTVSPLDSAGRASITRTITTNTDLSAKYSGDDLHEPAALKEGVMGYAKITTSLAGQYATSGAYAVFHRTATPRYNVTVLPRDGYTYVVFVAQRYYSGAWHTVATYKASDLDRYGRTAVYFSGSFAAGSVYRMQARSSPTRTSVATASSFSYLRFTN